MLAKRLLLPVVTVPFLLVGCAGFLVLDTSDPDLKLQDASHLYWKQGRALIAERLTWEAMEIYRGKQDFLGLGHAHRQYADFLVGPPIERWEGVYREHGFRDKSITYDSRTIKSKEYYRKSIDFYELAENSLISDNKYDQLSNLYYI